MNTRSLLSSLVCVATIACLGACSDSTSASGSTASGDAHIRIINALFQGPDTTTAVGVPIDFLVDSSSAAPGVLNLAPGALTTGDSANGYASIAPGLHGFVARLAGNTSADGSLYTTTNNLPYLPKQRLTANTYYTIIVSGYISNTLPVTADAISFMAMADDPFPGGVVGGVTQARFGFINAAPYTTPDAAGTYLRLYFTPGATPPANLLDTVTPTDQYVAYRCAFGCRQHDAAPGTYTVTVADQFSNTIYAQAQVTMSAGDVYTFVVQSSGPTGPNNNYIRVIHDHSVP